MDSKDLKDTVDGMISDDYEERFKAEFDQLGIRALNLWTRIQHWNDWDHESTCSKDLLTEQNDIQWLGIKIMKRRAYIEKIKLDWDPENVRFNMVKKNHEKRIAKYRKQKNQQNKSEDK